MSDRYLHVETIGSTNAYLLQHASALEDLTFLRADYQSAGKGRGDHGWESPKGENLLFSVLVKDHRHLDHGAFLSLVAATEVARLLQSYGVTGVTIKWPNDIYVRGKKICGILLQGDLPSCLVIGIGLNVAQTRFEGEYRVTPTSMVLEGAKATVDEVCDRLYRRIENAFASAIRPEEYLAYYADHDFLLGRHVEVGGEEGIVAGVDASFALLLQTPNGVRRALGGEVHCLD